MAKPTLLSIIPAVPKKWHPRTSLSRRLASGPSKKVAATDEHFGFTDPQELIALAVPHFSVGIISRGAARSAVLSEAYRQGRFGERTFLGNAAAKYPDGGTYRTIAADMSPVQISELRAAWDLMRASQILAIHEQRAEGLKESLRLRAGNSQGLTLR
ncbi:hypothetical protein PY650_10770 [Rhizobium calliandrae]|uniref:Uncharacterized protein n=1 Tax=Rhizobium calliandrae TaxID=1312182 RepID=A0ABT7KBZ4_9HYPH|nr:hypothetical protein [Rhizobium calliandrae]MDL2406141.1 hypothetical protein [Rhizobium calliandrae]